VEGTPAREEKIVSLHDAAPIKVNFNLDFAACRWKEHLQGRKAKTNQNNLREVFANYLIEKNQKEEFIHQDYFALALNYFVQRMNTESKLKFTITNSHMGQY